MDNGRLQFFELTFGDCVNFDVLLLVDVKISAIVICTLTFTSFPFGKTLINKPGDFIVLTADSLNNIK